MRSDKHHTTNKKQIKVNSVLLPQSNNFTVEAREEEADENTFEYQSNACFVNKWQIVAAQFIGKRNHDKKTACE